MGFAVRSNGRVSASFINPKVVQTQGHIEKKGLIVGLFLEGLGMGQYSRVILFAGQIAASQIFQSYSVVGIELQYLFKDIDSVINLTEFFKNIGDIVHGVDVGRVKS